MFGTDETPTQAAKQAAVDAGIPGVDKPIDRTPPKHPIACFFHLFFKIAALIVYVFMSLFYDNFVIIFVIVICMCALDFWTTKNVTGRLLVGLRWWNEVKEDGTSHWIFESYDSSRGSINQIEMIIFWVALFAAPICWTVLAIFALIKINWDWLVIVIICVCLTGANIAGYIKCARDQRSQFKKAAMSYATKMAVNEGIRQMSQKV